MVQIHARTSAGCNMRSIIEFDPSFRTVAYFSMEVGIKKSIPTYSGGLGLLAGDILKSAADLGIPTVGITLLYRKGYFEQTFNPEHWQTEKPVSWHPEQELSQLPNEVSVTIQGHDIRE